ncbi:hypothetical protein Q9L58_010812, partial [Maublancomyces gigas]
LLLFAALAASAWGQTTKPINGGQLVKSCDAVAAATSNNPGTQGGCASLATPAPNGQLAGGFTWQTLTTGSPASVSVTFVGSIDGTTWKTLDTSTATGGEIRSITGNPMRFVGCVPGTMSGGTNPTVTCQVTLTTASSGGGGSGGGGTGTVTSITAGTGLSGGTITGSGTIALLNALPNGETATTQAPGDATTKVATDAFVNAALLPTGTACTPLINVTSATYATSPLYCDASQFTAHAPDVGAQIADACIAAIAAGIGRVDASSFTGTQYADTNWVHACNPAATNMALEIDLNPDLIMVTSVPQFTPYSGFKLYSGVESNSSGAAGARITGCGPLSPGWDAVNLWCLVGAHHVAQFPNSTNQLTFNYHHGPFAAGTYAAVVNIG